MALAERLQGKPAGAGAGTEARSESAPAPATPALPPRVGSLTAPGVMGPAGTQTQSGVNTRAADASNAKQARVREAGGRS